jgi:hypothetical protein
MKVRVCTASFTVTAQILFDQAPLVGKVFKNLIIIDNKSVISYNALKAGMSGMVV